MTGYDVFVILVLLASCAAGWFRGGVRELTALFSFFLAGLLALITLPWTAPFGRSLVDPDWAGSVLAVGLTFLILYFGLRLLGSAISKGARGNALGAFDQVFGLA
ncbi:MAG: CvpA family protein, partial [Brevundimonas sp.]